MFRYIVFMLTFLLMQNCFAAKIYKWKDENGVLQFSTTPPLDSSKKIQKVGSTHKKVKAPLEEAILGDWKLTNNDGLHSAVHIKSRYIRFYYKKDRDTPSVGKSGKYILNGKTIEVEYQSHDDKSMVGQKENYFVRRISEKKITLVNVTERKSITYFKDAFGKSNEGLTSKAKMLIGTWESKIYDRTITFKGTDFSVKEKRKNYRKLVEVMRGSWEYKDPYILFNITKEKEGSRTRLLDVKQSMKFYIIGFSEFNLKVRNENKSIEEFYLIKK